MKHIAIIRLSSILFIANISVVCIPFVNAQKISLGKGNVLYICADSTISAIGLNSGYTDAWDSTYFKYQLGDGTDIDRYYPVKVKGLKNVVAVNAIGSLALLSDGTIWKWAENNNYNLHRIDIDNVVAISVGLQSYVQLFYCALKKDGSLWLWGDAKLKNSSWWSYSDSIEKMDIPKVKKVEAGQETVIALCEDGSVWTWGNACIEGNGTYNSDVFYIWKPSKVNTINDVVDICAGIYTVYALKSDGTVWEWGWDASPGKCYDNYPVKLKISDVKYIHTGFFDLLYAIKKDGTLWYWKDSVDNYGISYSKPYTYPKQVNSKIIFGKVFTNKEAIYALDNMENTYRWGNNTNGQLGNFTTFPIDSPDIMIRPCLAVDCDTITHNPDILRLDTLVYPGLPVKLKTSPSEADLYWWYPEGNIISGNNSQEATVYISNDTEFTVVLMDAYGCMRKERFMLRKKCDTNVKLAMDSVTYPESMLVLKAGEGNFYTWTPATNLSCIHCKITKARIKEPITYTVSYTDVFNCPVQEKFSIRIRDCDTIVKNEEILVFDTLISPGSWINLIASKAASYKWSPSTGLSCDTCQQTAARIYENTEYTVALTDDYNCSWREKFRLTNNCDSSTLSNPRLIIDTVTYPQALINLYMPPGRYYSWQPSTDLSCNDCNNPVATVKESIVYIASMTDSFYCKSKGEFIISVRDCDTIVLQDDIVKLDTIIHYTTEISLIASESTINYIWSPTKGLSCTDCQNPILTANSTNEYRVITYDQWRCPVNEVFRITLIKIEIVIPNIFTPNSDGINDFFEVKGLVPGSFLKIYNGNGVLVYSSVSYEGNWDGNDSKGNPLDEGTYWYNLFIPESDTYKGWVYIKRK
jgi:gliding motility-associated-like protein